DVDGEVGVGPSGQYRAVPGSGGGCTQSRIGRRQRLRDVPPQEQIGPLVADVVDFECRVSAHRALDGKRPLLNVRVPWLRGHAYREEGIGRGRRGAKAGKTGKHLIRGQWSCLAESLDIVYAAHIGIDVRGAIDLASFGRIEEDAIAAPHHGLIVAERPEGEAKVRGKDPLRGVLGILPAGKFVVAAVADNALV